MSALPEPDTAAAIEFLQASHPEGPWHLVAMAGEGGPEARTFNPGEERAMRAWIDERQGKANLYFAVNPLKPEVRDRKSRKDDVHCGAFLHVDIDDVEALAALAAFSPRPTCVVFSGGGYQAFWRLEEPCADLERVEACNRYLAEQLGGDNCHNIDRIMRVPGTINVPNAKKRARGRAEALAYVVAELTDWSRSYAISEFPHSDDGGQKGERSPVAAIPDHVELDALPTGVSPFTKTLIIDGDDPEAPRGSVNARYPSRSEAVFRAACDLARAGCRVEQITSILLDPAYKISESIRERRHGARAYALRQAQAALDAASTGWPDVTAKGHPRPTYRNAVVAIRRLGLVGENDEFHRRRKLSGMPMQQFVGELSDDVAAHLRQLIIETFDFDPGKTNTIEAANYVCLENTFHPVRDYLAQMQWDGVKRLDTWLSRYLGAEDTELNRAIARLVLIAAVRRVREPGVKFDNILVLEGPQGTGKSTAIRILAGDENFSDQDILTLDAKQQMEAMEGVWLYEISELSGLNRSEITKVKAFASRQVDRGRPAYGRFREDRSRQTVFIGTTNEETYLRDTTGNRRFWGTRTGAIDLQALARDRDQLWAEAAYAEAAGESLQLPEALWPAAAEQQEARLEEHPWLDVLARVTGAVHEDMARITTRKVFEELQIPAERRQGYHAKTIAHLMVKLGWTPTKIREGNSTLRGYEREATDADIAASKRPGF